MSKKKDVLQVGPVTLTLREGGNRAYAARGNTAGAAAELLIATAVGKKFVDTIPNRVALLQAEDGAGHRALRIAAGIDQPQRKPTKKSAPQADSTKTAQAIPA